MSEYFEIVCTCCDKTQIDMQILPKINRRKNHDFFNMLFNRPKYVDPQILIQFFLVLNGSKGALSTTTATSNNENSEPSSHLIETKSQLLKNLERVFNHVEFARKLDPQTLANVDTLEPNLSSANNFSSAAVASSANTNSSNLTYIFRETMNLIADETLDSIIR